MTMTKKILCPVDGSDHSDVGLVRAAELARLTGAHLTICAVNLAVGGARGPTINHSDVAKALQRAALTRTGGIAVAPPQLPAQMRIGKQTVPAMKQQPMIISGRVAKPTTVVVAGDD